MAAVSAKIKYPEKTKIQKKNRLIMHAFLCRKIIYSFDTLFMGKVSRLPGWIAQSTWKSRPEWPGSAVFFSASSCYL
jgi:hypothetical protein